MFSLILIVVDGGISGPLFPHPDNIRNENIIKTDKILFNEIDNILIL